VHGSICTDQPDLLYRIDMFRELCKEQGAYGKAKTFPSSPGKKNCFLKAESAPDYEPLDDTICEVILLAENAFDVSYFFAAFIC
jgi:hypothetical protein